MAHYTTSRRTLAATDPKTPMDPTNKKQTKSPSFTKTHQDSTNPSSTIHSLSQKFTNLYTNPNHNKGLPPQKTPNPPPKPSTDAHLGQFQSKSMAVSANGDASSKTHLKSSHQHRKSVLEMEKDRLRASINGSTDHKFLRNSHDGCEIKDLLEIDIPKAERIKTSSKKGRDEKESHEGCDIKRALVSLSRSQEFELKESHENTRRASFSVVASGGGGGGRRRRSICNPQAELGDFLRVNGVKIVSVDMPPFMQVHAVGCARKVHDSLEKFTSKTLALSLKKEFDGVYGPAWHCIVGASFGSFVTHSVGGFMYFSMDQKLYILLFKTTVQRAD